MPELVFSLRGTAAALEAVQPSLELEIGIDNRAGSESVHGALVNCQVFVDPARREHTPGEVERLSPLFGPLRDWPRTLRRIAWITAPIVCPAFTGATRVRLVLPCPLEPEGSIGKYLWALESGEVPIGMAFSGTVLYRAPGRDLAVVQIPWSSELSGTLPRGPLAELRRSRGERQRLELSHHVFERLYAFQRAELLTSWDATIERLIERGARP